MGAPHEKYLKVVTETRRKPAAGPAPAHLQPPAPRGRGSSRSWAARLRRARCAARLHAAELPASLPSLRRRSMETMETRVLALEDDNRALRRRVAELEASVRTLLATTARQAGGPNEVRRRPAQLVPVPLDDDDEKDGGEPFASEDDGTHAQSETRPAPPAPKKRRRRDLTGSDRYCGAAPGKRLQYRFETTTGETEWFSGSVTKLLALWPGWVGVRFDDGATLEVRLERDGEGDFWRWEPAASPADCRAAVAHINHALGGADALAGARWRRGCPSPEREAGSSNRSDDDEGEPAVLPARKSRQPRSRFTGVTWSKKQKKWMASLKHDGKTHYLGCFPRDAEEDAARAFDAGARCLRGAQAHDTTKFRKRLRLNFPTKNEIAAAKKLRR